MDQVEQKIYNPIDMETDIVDDDDFGSGQLKPNQSFMQKSKDFVDESYSDNYLKPEDAHWGVTVDFSDDDIGAPRTSKQRSIEVPQLPNNIAKPINEFQNPNEIDMETDTCEDDDDFGFVQKKFTSKEDLDEKASQTTTTGKVEADYWKKLAKKHEKTNVKGAYYHFGDGEREAELFNHDMGTASHSPAEGAAISGSITGAAAGGDAGGAAGGCCENYKKLCEDLLYITGFVVTPKNGKFDVKDTLGDCDDICCNSKEEVISHLKPYIDDSIIYPLQAKTGKKFDNYNDWCDWYNSEEGEDFADCEEDIKYCDLLANHLKELEF